MLIHGVTRVSQVFKGVRTFVARSLREALVKHSGDTNVTYGTYILAPVPVPVPVS